MNTLNIGLTVMAVWIGIALILAVGNWCVHEAQVRAKGWKRKRKEWTPPIGCKLFGHQWADSGHRIPVIAFLESPLGVCDRCGGGRYMHLMSTMNFTPKAVSDYFAQCEAEKAGKVANINGGLTVGPIKVAEPEGGPTAS